jgi:hypothetical protein
MCSYWFVGNLFKKTAQFLYFSNVAFCRLHVDEITHWVKRNLAVIHLAVRYSINLSFIWTVQLCEVFTTSKVNSASANSVVITGSVCQLIYVVLTTGHGLKCLKKSGPCVFFRGHVVIRHRIIAKSAFWLYRVRLSVHMEQLFSHGTNFHEVLHWGNLNLSRRIKFFLIGQIYRAL